MISLENYHDFITKPFDELYKAAIIQEINNTKAVNQPNQLSSFFIPNVSFFQMGRTKTLGLKDENKIIDLTSANREPEDLVCESSAVIFCYIF